MSGPLTPNIFMSGASMGTKVLIRYRLLECNIKLMGEIGVDNVFVTSVGPAADEVMDFRLQVSVYDQVFVRSAFDLAERGADMLLEALVMRSVGKVKTLVTRLTGSCQQSQSSGGQIELVGRLKKVSEEEVKQSISDACRQLKIGSN
ncbi:hypothetical protein BOX15_Mlig013168g1 [Macrostomum lignano]|uniref:Uncharacterized protein n=1 Tax=Macrostomum lignano TaxID=282301 RepID=A0A267EUQ1_9PLAT|nr:hypothetical protein BOX15_Mlig013168g1 [Macrostomum lignano]